MLNYKIDLLTLNLNLCLFSVLIYWTKVEGVSLNLRLKFTFNIL